MFTKNPPESISLTPGKRILFLTKDLELIKQQLYHGLNLQMSNLKISNLLDDINTDVMTPAWVCFSHKPEDIAIHAYAGLMHNGKRIFKDRALIDGNFEVIVAGLRKGTGSSRETAAQCERFSGIRMSIAASFAPIHERNNINLGQLCANHETLLRLQHGQSIKLDDIIGRYDQVTQLILKSGGLFSFSKQLASGQITLPKCETANKPMTMAEKIITLKASDPNVYCVRPGDTVVACVDGGYSHEFTSAQVHEFLKDEFGQDYQLKNPSHFATFEDHLVYAEQVKKLKPFLGNIQTLREKQNEFKTHTKVRDYGAKDGISPGICHEIARQEFIEPGQLIQATDSHTCMGGCLNTLSYGVGATEYGTLAYSGQALIKVPESIRFELNGELNKNCTAKDLMLYILLNFAKKESTLNRVIEFAGPGLNSLSIDERATLCNMATECTAKTGICEGDDKLAHWISTLRPGFNKQKLLDQMVFADADAHYDGGVHQINLVNIKPMVAAPSDPINGKLIEELGNIAIDIAYGGSCTAGKFEDIEFYAKVVGDALDRGLKIKSSVQFFIQFGTHSVRDMAIRKGYVHLFEKAGVKLIEPGCGACIGCGPGVSENETQVSISAINRNFQGRSGPGQLYLASPLSVAASAFAGKIVSFK